MRTTVDLDATLLKRLRIEARRRGVTVKELLATLLRRGLDEKVSPTRRYRCPSFSMGNPAGVNLDKALSVAAGLEDDEHARELTLRK
ncbi:MAG: hypothetical protein ACREOK_04515 [Gemmatimonadaceae bacterium]